MIKSFIIYENKNADTSIWIEEGKILKISTYSYGWHEVFSKDIPGNKYMIKRQLKHAYSLDPDTFRSIFKTVNLEDQWYSVLKEILEERRNELENELKIIKTLLN